MSAKVFVEVKKEIPSLSKISTEDSGRMVQALGITVERGFPPAPYCSEPLIMCITSESPMEKIKDRKEQMEQVLNGVCEWLQAANQLKQRMGRA